MLRTREERENDGPFNDEQELTMRYGGADRCILCGKWSNQIHKQTDRHLQPLQWYRSLQHHEQLAFREQREHVTRELFRTLERSPNTLSEAQRAYVRENVQMHRIFHPVQLHRWCLICSRWSDPVHEASTRHNNQLWQLAQLSPLAQDELLTRWTAEARRHPQVVMWENARGGCSRYLEMDSCEEVCELADCFPEEPKEILLYADEKPGLSRPVKGRPLAPCVSFCVFACDVQNIRGGLPFTVSPLEGLPHNLQVTTGGLLIAYARGGMMADLGTEAASSSSVGPVANTVEEQHVLYGLDDVGGPLSPRPVGGRQSCDAQGGLVTQEPPPSDESPATIVKVRPLSGMP